MPFVPLGRLLPEVAKKETRAIYELEGAPEPVRAYLFEELFCDEPGCDCRRVMIQVISDAPSMRQPRATLSWGWEPEEFYRRWAGFPLDDEDLEELRGPGLARMAPQSEEAPELLERFRMLLEDEAYAARIVQHYRAFRERIEGGEGRALGANRAERRRRRSAERRPVRRAR